jgi:hypothetical protein
MKTALLFLLVIMHSPVWASGPSQPPSWGDFEVASANGNFLAQVKAIKCPASNPQDSRRQACDFKLSVLRKDGGELLWSCLISYPGENYCYQLLSNDGQTFVFIDKEYTGDGIVSIFTYRNGHLLDILKVGQVAFRDLQKSPVLIEDADQIFLELTNIRDQKIRVDLNNFEIKNLEENA